MDEYTLLLTRLSFLFILSYLFFFFYFLSRNLGKKTTQKLCVLSDRQSEFSPLEPTLITPLLPFPHSSSGYKKLITPSGKKLVPLYPGFLMYPAFFDPTNDNKHFTTKQITVKKQSLPLMNMPGFRMSLISISLCRFYSTPKRQFLS